MTAPSFPFQPTIQTSTSIYLPHANLAIDGLPPYHGYTFQEKQVALANGILRPHDVYSGEELHRALAAQDKEREERLHGMGIDVGGGQGHPAAAADHHAQATGSTGRFLRPLTQRHEDKEEDVERAGGPPRGYSFLSIPTDSSRGTSDESERKTESVLSQCYPRTSTAHPHYNHKTNATLFSEAGGEADGVICVRPPSHLADLKPIWKHHNTRVPPSAALMGSVGSFRPSLDQREAALAFHRRQRRQAYPPQLPSLHSREEIEDYIDTLRAERVEVNPDIEKAIEMLQSPEDFTKQFHERRAREALQEQQQPRPASSSCSGKASPSPPALVLEVDKPTFHKLSSSIARASSGQQKTGKKGKRWREKSNPKARGPAKANIIGLPPAGGEESTPNEAAEEEQVDDNQSAIKALFGFMKRGELHKLEEEEEEEAEEDEDEDEDEDEEDGSISYVPCPSGTLAPRPGCQCPLMNARYNSNSSGGNATMCKPTHFSPSAKTMFDIPRPYFDQVPHGSALQTFTVSNDHTGTSAGEEGHPPLSDEVVKHLRWIVYQEEYERTLLFTEEQQYNPIPYYGSFVADPGRPALLERLRHPLELTDAADLHRGVDTALDKAIQNILGEVEKPPTPPPPPPPISAPTLLDICYQEAREEKEEIFEYFGAIHDNLRERLALFQEEKTARLQVLSHFVSCKYPEPCRCLLWDMEILEESNVELEPAVPPTCVFVSAVLSFSQLIQEDLLAERQRELDNMKAQLECYYFSAFSWEHFLQDEQRQWNKILLYHQYCMQLASKRHSAAALWCMEHGLETLEADDSDSDEEQEHHHPNGEKEESISNTTEAEVAEVAGEEDGVSEQTGKDQKSALTPPPGQLPYDPEDNDRDGQSDCKSSPPVTASASKENRGGGQASSKPPLDLKAMRRCRLHCLGPNDSPFCSYLKFLEVIITTVLEQDGRQNVLMNESQEASNILKKMCASFSQASIATQEREAREGAEIEEIFEREAIARESIEWQAIVPGVHLLETERFARQDVIAVDMEKVQQDALEGAKQISLDFQREYMVLWRSVHTELLDLRRRCMTKEQELDLVNEWMSEEPRQYLENEQSRHRMKIMNEEKHHRWLLSGSFLWLKDTYIPNRDWLELREEQFERQKIILLMEEGAARINLMATNSAQRVSLFHHVLVGEDDVKRQRLERLKARRRVLPPEFNFRRQVVSDLYEFASMDEIADIFDNDFVVT